LNVVFLNIGPEVMTASLLARSIRARNPGAKIIQTTDALSPAVPGVDEVQRVAGDSRKIMTFRLLCFSKIDASAPTWFLDTDMLCLKPLPTFDDKDGPTAGVCVREFDRTGPFNHAFNGMDLGEYKGMTLGAVYPYLACTTFVRNDNFWERCLQSGMALHPKFHLWYGDQEAIKRVVAEKPESFTKLLEGTYACLPEYEKPGDSPVLMHFKGGRKAQMLPRAQKEKFV
jgi:hypothetical protein